MLFRSLSLGLALQPWSILAAVLLAASERGRLKSLLFLAGWLAALAVVAVAAVLLGRGNTRSSPSRGLAWLEILVGVALGCWLLLRARAARGARTAPDPPEPRWMAGIDSSRPAFAFVLGGFLPNYLLMVAAVAELVQLNLAATALWLWTTAFVMVASLGVATPPVLLLVRGEHARTSQEHWRVWLVAHSTVLLRAVAALLAALLVLKGLVTLS